MKTVKLISHRAVERHLMHWGAIDRLTALTKYKVGNLTAVLSNLKKEGWEFDCLKDYAPNTKWRVTKNPHK